MNQKMYLHSKYHYAAAAPTPEKNNAHVFRPATASAPYYNAVCVLPLLYDHVCWCSSCVVDFGQFSKGPSTT